MVDVATLVVGALATGYSAYAGENQASVQRKGLRRQQDAQQRAEAKALSAEAKALSQERRAEQEQARAKQKAPDLDVLLGENQPKPGALGINQNQLLLGNRYLGR